VELTGDPKRTEPYSTTRRISGRLICLYVLIPAVLAASPVFSQSAAFDRDRSRPSHFNLSVNGGVGLIQAL